MRLDASGNLGLGVTPSAWKSTFKAIQLGAASSIYNNSAGDTFIGANFYTDTSDVNRYLTTTLAAAYGQLDGTHAFFTAPSGTAGDAITFTQAMTLNASGNLGIRATSMNAQLSLKSPSASGDQSMFEIQAAGSTSKLLKMTINQGADVYTFGTDIAGSLAFQTNATERMRIDTNGNLLVGKTAVNSAVAGIENLNNGVIALTSTTRALYINRLSTDGDLVEFAQAGTTEGTISVSGTTVSYNGGHLARWSQLLDNSKDESILKGTVLSNLDEMCVWNKDGEQLENEQLNKMKVSDVEGDTNVAGVFVNWTFDQKCQSDDMNIAMTGDMIIRIAEGVTVQRGDLLMSAGDGTAKPQGDDIVRSKTIAKVTSTNVTCTYADGSYCVPCVLMAC
jgi:hypothetical protein